METITSGNTEIIVNPITVYAEQVGKGVAALEKYTSVADRESLKGATEMLNRAKKLQAIVQKEVDNICRPLKDRKKELDEAQRAVKAFAGDLVGPLSEVGAKVERAVLAFHRAEEERVREERRKQMEAEERARKEATEHPEGEREAPAMPTPAPVVEPPKVKGLTSTWKYEVEDGGLVPRIYCSPDAGKLQAAVRSGQREIPGVRIWEEKGIRRN